MKRMGVAGWLTSAAWGMIASAAAAQVTPPPLETYGRLPAVEQVQISPDGDRLMQVVAEGENRAVIITNLSDQRVLGGMRADRARLRNVEWLGNDAILAVGSEAVARHDLGMDRSEMPVGQMFDIPSRRTTIVLRNTPGLLGYMGRSTIRDVDGQAALFVESQNIHEGNSLNLYRVDLQTGRGRVVEEGTFEANGFVLDQNGEAVARTSHNGQNGRWQLQMKRGGFWPAVWETRSVLDAPSLVSLGRTEGTVIVYVSKTIGEGDDAIAEGFYEVDGDGNRTALSTDGKITALFHHPVTHLLIGMGRQIDDQWRYDFTDPQAARAWRSAATAFAGRRPQLVSWSDDMRTVVVETTGPGETGVYHLVDLDAGRADIIGEAYPGITAEQVAQVRSIRYAAADGLEIPAYLTLPPGRSPQDLPLIVLPHGGPQARDYLGFDWWAQALASRGYAVLQPNFRGSDGYGQAFVEAGYGEWGKKMQSDLSDGVRHLAAEGTIDPARVCIAGASYGGYAAMAGPTLEPEVYRCAVAVAGVSDLRAMVAWTADRGGRTGAGVQYWNRFMGAERLGDRSLDERSPARLADRVTAPMLLIHGVNDTVVPPSQSRTMATALSRAGKFYEYVELPGEDHWLSSAATRTRMLSEMVRFIETYNPPGVASATVSPPVDIPAAAPTAP